MEESHTERSASRAQLPTPPNKHAPPPALGAALKPRAPAELTGVQRFWWTTPVPAHQIFAKEDADRKGSEMRGRSIPKKYIGCRAAVCTSRMVAERVAGRKRTRVERYLIGEADIVKVDKTRWQDESMSGEWGHQISDRDLPFWRQRYQSPVAWRLANAVKYDTEIVIPAVTRDIFVELSSMYQLT